VHLSSIGTPLLWAGFAGVVAAALALDLGVFHRHPHRIGLREAVWWSAAWVALSLGAAAVVAARFDAHRGLQFLAGWLVEKALSVDNLLVFVVIFQQLRVPARLQHRVLYWGILGAVVTRGLFVAAGATLVQSFQWVLYGFGAFLVVTGVRLMLTRTPRSSTGASPATGRAARWLRRVLGVRDDRESGAFFVDRRPTTLFLVLCVIELADVMFAVDSIPAVFGVTRDPFLVYTSNVFAVLGLRALYFVVARLVEGWQYLKAGLALVLLFIGAKMLVEEWLPVPIPVSLATVAALLGLSALASIAARRRRGSPDVSAMR
jgi:TerC family integral membrane protein